MSLKLTIILISLILLVEISSAKSNHKSDLNWRNHARKHNLAFKSDDRESKAYDNYLTTDQLINKHNKDGSHRFKLAHNHLSHLVYINLNL
jgi:hypothetical protein